MSQEDYKRRFTSSANFRTGTLGAALTTVLANVPPSEAVKTAIYSIAATDHLREIIVTAAVTITVPAHTVLGVGFQCWVLADGNTVVLDGPGGTNLSLSSGDIAQIRVLNSKVRAWKNATTDLTTA
jgi:hypothetical protein